MLYFQTPLIEYAKHPIPCFLLDVNLCTVHVHVECTSRYLSFGDNLSNLFMTVEALRFKIKIAALFSPAMNHDFDNSQN